MNSEIIEITIEAYPEIFEDIEGGGSKVINNAEACCKEQLENPISDQLNSFVNNYVLDILTCSGFHGFNNRFNLVPECASWSCEFSDASLQRRLLVEFKIADNPFDLNFPEALKPKILECLQMDNIFDNLLQERGINLWIHTVRINELVVDNTADALDVLYNELVRLRHGPHLNGVFWYNDVAREVLCHQFGSIDCPEAISKSGNTYNHRRLWNALCSDNRPYNYYPRGRVDWDRLGKATIYLNPNIDESVINQVKVNFGIRPSDKCKIKYDYSNHYKSHLDQGWKADS